MKKIILASASPRRKEILKNIGLEFEVIPSKFKESDFRNEKFTYEIIENSSYCKAEDIVSALFKEGSDALVLAADTMVILDSVCLLKPQDISEAFLLLKKLSGRVHEVVTAVTLIDVLSGKSLTESCTTEVEFRELFDEEIRRYIEDYSPLDKAGSYGIQDFVDEKTVLCPPKESFISRISGDYYNVVGLSSGFVLNMLRKFNSSP